MEKQLKELSTGVQAVSDRLAKLESSTPETSEYSVPVPQLNFGLSTGTADTRNLGLQSEADRLSEIAAIRLTVNELTN